MDAELLSLLHLPGLAGVDEAGRGPLAGPVVAAAVILDPKRPIAGLNDSKKLSARRREQLFDAVSNEALDLAVGMCTPAEIDAVNILQASLLAMQRAVEALSDVPSLAVVDGHRTPKLACPVQALVRGDALLPAISAASIIAKVTRDRLMLALDQQFPGYGFAVHKGYPTARHLAALAERGVSPVHRRSFAPVQRLLAADS
ncbi:RNase HII [Ectothiorhodosinus mongolicus]|uniref:Ribonuclease HII n=1 Tax=Ectothiorhodosinus mongolicus TaxID=233100 RepID=A0A1R3VN09_9GAMM|nr:ribonuclease HII [Ectothiorhodosinus mongolicus]SIT65864.1 RNase HII [Ectothiorhodosinus mongolicus]